MINLFPQKCWAGAITIILPIAAYTGLSGAAEMTDVRILIAQNEKPSAQGTISSVDSSRRRLKISHGPVEVLHWPAMTMEFDLAPNVDIGTLTPGSKINFSLTKGSDGKYVVDEVSPAK